MQLCGSLSILCSRLSGLFLIQQIGTTGRKGFFLWAVNIFHDCSFSLLLSHYVVSDCFLTPWTGASFLLPRSSQPRDQTFVSYFGKWVLYYWASREALTVVLTPFQKPPRVPHGSLVKTWTTPSLVFGAVRGRTTFPGHHSSCPCLACTAAKSEAMLTQSCLEPLLPLPQVPFSFIFC